MKVKQIIYIIALSIAIFLSSCSTDTTKPGREYMPDMGHSIAYEANVLTDYSWNTWEEASVNNGSGLSIKKLSLPVNVN